MKNGVTSIKLEDLVCMESPPDVMGEVDRMMLSIYPQFDLSLVRNAFDHIVRLFRGEYPGYRECNIHYHDLKHTTDCFMAMARLIHGAVVRGIEFEERLVVLGLIAALMHDTGYIQSREDLTGTGAKYTLMHVERSIEFMRDHFDRNGYSPEDFAFCVACLECTGLTTKIDAIVFESEEHGLIGKMLGTADLLGQMADRTYLERLPFLYLEFVEGGVPGFVSEFDLLQKTPGFWDFTKQRFATDLSGVSRFMGCHFMVRWGFNRDLYRVAIESNIRYIKCLVDDHPNDYRKYLRRSGYVKILDAMQQSVVPSVDPREIECDAQVQ